MAFEAKFHQGCARCGHDVQGAQAVYEGNDLVHVDCPASRLDLQSSDVVCTECWLVKPCACQDGQ